MPNWCENTITIQGSRENIKHFLDTVKGEEECIDFNKIIPMPPELKEVDSYGSLEKDMELVKKEISGETLTAEEQENLNLLENGPSMGKNSGKENAKLALFCLEHYGAKDWFDWSVQHWGVKWTASNSEVCYKESDGEAIMYFDTPWNYPEPIFKEMAKIFPNLYFEILCTEPDVGFGARFEYDEGRIQTCLKGDYHAFYYEDE